jgi:hypothetical protein
MCFLLFSCGNDNKQDDITVAPQNYEGLTTIQFQYSRSDESIARPYSYEAAIYDENDGKIFSKTWSKYEFSLALKNDEDEDGLILLENVPAGQYRNLVILGKDSMGATILRGEVETSISASQANPTIYITAEDFKATLLEPSDKSVSTWENLPDFLWESSNAEKYIIRIQSSTGNIITETIDTNSYSPTALASRISTGTVPEIITSSCPDTGQIQYFDYENSSEWFTFDQDYYGQDAHYSKFQLSYTAIEYDGKQLFATSNTPQKYVWDVIPVDQYGNAGAHKPRGFTFSIIWPVTRDNNTGLMWATKTQDDGSTHDTNKILTWQEAHALLDEINSQAYCGFTDWRIPNVQELSCIFTCESDDRNNLQYFPKYFPNTSPAEYWTDAVLDNYSTPFEPDVSAWRVDFASGKIYEKNHSAEPARVRFVRGEPITTILTDNGDGTISDSGSGLMWSKAVAGPMTWKEALQYCEGLNDSYDDWRLPNRNELISIIDYSRNKPTDPGAIDPLFVDSNYVTNEELSLQYWTATTDDNNESNAYTVNFSYGEVSTNNKVFAENIMVRPVRYIQ